MRTEISTRHGHLSAETQEKITNKLSKLSRFHERLSEAHITIDLRDEDRPDVEITALIDRAPNMVAKTHGSNLMGAIDGAIQKVEQQLKKHKEKVIDHVRDSARKNQNAVADVDDGAED